MSGKVEDILMLLAAGEFSLGILGNAFIGLVNFMDWIKNRKICSIDLILTSLAISRISLLCIILLDCLILVLHPDVYAAGKQMRIIDYLWTLTNHLTVWFATCLSIFYFLKIANFIHPLFLWMRWRIDSAIPRILLGCLALSVFISLPVTRNLDDDFRRCVKIKVKMNLTLRCRVNKAQYASIKIYLNLLTLLPFSVSLISFLLLILSLWRHTRRMQFNATGYRDPSIEAHVKAMRAVTSFLLLFIAYYLAYLVATSSYFMPETELAVIVGELIALICPSIHSVILILENKKLRKACLRVLWKVKYILQRRNC
uniref:Taste receptor type 2 n=1 Tax=Sus scrofa TaxID=9823 RepID=A0A8D1QMZ8_PIG